MVVTPNRVVVGLVLVGALLVATGPLPAGAVVDGEAPVATAGVATAPGSGEHATALVGLQATPETDNTITRIAVHPNGSATWTLRIRTRLPTDESEAEYRAFQDRFRENTSRHLGDFRESITGIVGGARAVTGREMRASGFSASTSIQSLPRRWGIVTFEFRWEGFAAVEGDRLLVGDVFEGGLFIAEGDAVEVVAPAGYRVTSADPTPDEVDGRVATWRGREDFTDRRPRVVLAQAGATGAGSLPWPALVGSAALAVAGLAFFGYRRYRSVRDGSDARGGTGGPEDDGAAGAATVDGASTATGSGGDVLKADEDYVLEALAENGGRMRQQAVAAELDWSRSKTSRVLGRMAEDGQVKKLQLGRENVIALPGELEE